MRTLNLTICLMLVAGVSRAEVLPDEFVDQSLTSEGLLYSVDHLTGNLLTIDPDTAAVQTVGPVGFNLVEGLTYYPPSDSLLAVDNATDQLISINRYSGVGTAIGPIGHDFVFGLTYSEANDVLYAVDTQSNDLLTLNPLSGAASNAMPLGFDFIGGLTDNPSTGVLYGADYGSDQIFVADLGGGLIGPIVDVAPSSLQGIAYDPTINDLYAISVEVGPDELLRIDPITDAINLVGPLNGVSLASLAYVPNSVPEPGSLCLALVIACFLTFGKCRY